MTKFKTTLLLTLLCAFMFSGCKKDNPRDKFIGTFNVLGNCQSNPYQVIIEASSVEDNYLNVKNLYADSATVLGVMNGDLGVRINTQLVGNVTYAGEMYFDENGKSTGSWFLYKNGVKCNGIITRIQ